MSNDPKTRVFVRDGVGRIRPLNEGRVERGGVNAAGRFENRPPPPAPMKPVAATPSNRPSSSGTSSSGSGSGNRS